MRTETKTWYDSNDYAALDNMSKEEVIELLEDLEGRWMPCRPGEYYREEELDESDFCLLKFCKAVDLAVRWLKKEAEQ